MPTERETLSLIRRAPFGDVEGATEDLKRLVFPGKASLALPDGTLTVRVFAGWKGAGKTVYLKKHREEAARRSIDHGFYASPLLADVPPSTATVIALAQARSRAEVLPMWTRLWRRAIVLSAGSHLLRDRHLSEYVTGDQAEQLAGFRHLRRLGEAVDVYDAFRITTNGRTRRIPLDDPEWDRFERLVGALLEQAPPITLYVDSLDREFDSAPSYWMRTQEGLLSALLDLINSDRFGARLHTTITVRDMVISSIMRSSHASKILDTGYVRTLNWDPASLGTLLVEKARLLPRSMMCKPELQRSDPVESWLGFSTVANVVRGVDENVTDYLIRHSRFIPRDIVDVGNAICLDIESSPASFTQERFRQIVSRMAQKFGREQLYISAQEIAADLLPPGLDDQSYFGALEHVKTIERCLERLLQEQHNDVLEMDRIRVLTHRIAQVFRPFLLTDGITDATLPSVILNSLWHNRVIGYRYPSTDQRVGCYRFYGVSSDSRFDLPDEDIELAIHPCILDAIPGLRAATSAPVLPDPNSDLL